MDTAIILEFLGLASVQWGPNASRAINTQSDYNLFASTWPAASGPVPTFAAMQTAWTNYQAAHPEYLKTARSQRDIIVQLFGLSAAQKAAIVADLTSGSPPKWQTSRSDFVWSQAPTFRNTTGTIQTESILVAVAFFIRETGNGNYLVNPSFSPTINIPAYT